MSTNTQQAKAKKFKGDNFKKVHNWHIRTLMELKQKINAYQKFMSELYSKVI